MIKQNIRAFTSSNAALRGGQFAEGITVINHGEHLRPPAHRAGINDIIASMVLHIKGDQVWSPRVGGPDRLRQCGHQGVP